MLVKDRMTPNPFTTTPDSGAGDTWLFMLKHNLTRLPVVDKEKLLGMITRKDFGARPDLNLRGTSVATRYLTDEQTRALNKVRIRDIMPADQCLVTIGQDAYIEHAARILRESKISGLPVVDDKGKLVGIITQSDILDAFLNVMAINKKGVRISMRVKNTPETLLQMGQVLEKHQVKWEDLISMEIPNQDPLIVIRIVTSDHKPIVNDLNAVGFKVITVTTRR